MITLNRTLILVNLLSVLCVACSNDKIQHLNEAENLVVGYGTVDAHFCTSAPSPAQQNLKYLFILDHSQSNQPGFPNPLTPNDVTNTDPAGARRYGPLVNFVNTLAPAPNTSTSFAMIDFSDTAAEVGTVQGFDASASDFVTQVTKDWIGGGTAAAPAPDDHGFTNYAAALKLALQLISADAQGEAASPVQPPILTAYVIVFVSDGIPTVATNNAASPIYTQTFSTDIGPAINSIMALKSDPTLGPLIANITLNTAYYDNGTQVVPAETLLQQMANAGNGQYLQFDSGANILYQQFAPPSRNILNQLADVFVENRNAVWWDDGNLYLDSDGDGLPDIIEMQYGSNPLNADSDGNGVSDLVEYRTKGKPCNDPACAPAGRDQYAICDGFSPVTNPADGSVTFSSTTNDGLNDCEKFLLQANRNEFNTNGDLIPDDYAFKSGLPIIAGSANSAFSDPFNDGIMNYAKLKLGYPVQVSDHTLLNFEPRTTSLTADPSPTPNVSCYHLIVGNIALTASDNTVKVMLVQNSSVLQDKPFLMNAQATFSGAANTASFLPGDFK